MQQKHKFKYFSKTIMFRELMVVYIDCFILTFMSKLLKCYQIKLDNCKYGFEKCINSLNFYCKNVLTKNYTSLGTPAMFMDAQKLYPKAFDFCKILKMREKNMKSANLRFQL